MTEDEQDQTSEIVVVTLAELISQFREEYGESSEPSFADFAQWILGPEEPEQPPEALDGGSITAE